MKCDCGGLFVLKSRGMAVCIDCGSIYMWGSVDNGKEGWIKVQGSWVI